jgi:hypothetical protein
MHFAKAVVMAGAMLQCGCMTTAGLVTGPVASIGSMAWHSSDAGSSLGPEDKLEDGGQVAQLPG